MDVFYYTGSQFRLCELRNFGHRVVRYAQVVLLAGKCSINKKYYYHCMYICALGPADICRCTWSVYDTAGAALYLLDYDLAGAHCRWHL